MVSLKEFRKICFPHHCKNRKTIGWMITRPFSIYFTWIFSKTNLNAEKVCFSWVMTALIGSLFFYTGNYWLALVGLLLFHIGLVLDCSDGEVARFRKETSIRGPYLDLIGHAIVNPVLLLGIGFYSYQNPMFGLHPVIFLMAGAFSAIFLINTNMARLKVYEALIDNNLPVHKQKERIKKTSSNLKVSLRELLRIGPGSMFYLFTIFNILPIYILFMVVFSFITYIHRVWVEFRNLMREYDKKH